MNKKIYFLILIIFIFISGCAINDLLDVINNSDNINPKWDLGMRIPVFNKDISFRQYVGDTSIDSYSGSVQLTQWPLADETTGNLSGSAPINTVMDLDSNGSNDFNIYGIYCNGASLKLKLWFTLDSSIIPIQENIITLMPVRIEGVTYNVSNPVQEGDYLVYTLVDFPSINNDYYINFGGDPLNDYSRFNIEELTVNLTENNTDYPEVPGVPYFLNYEVVFTLGYDFGLVGVVFNDFTLIDDDDNAIPNLDTLESLRNFGFESTFNNRIVSDINLTLTFDCDPPEVPDPNIHQTVIVSGNQIFNDLNNYYYVLESRQTEDVFVFNGNFLDYKNMNMTTTAIFLSSAQTILLSTTDFVNVQVNIIGDATFSF